MTSSPIPAVTLSSVAVATNQTLAAPNGIAFDNLGNLAASSLIEGNLIGTDVKGTNALHNAGDGVVSNASKITIGGTAPGAGNIIAGNLGDGIAIDSFAAANVVQGDFIGLDPSGAAIGNGGDGIRIENSSGNQIGGTNVQSGGAIGTLVGNVIAGNFGNGIEIDFSLAMNNVVLGNRIGTDLGGTRALPADLILRQATINGDVGIISYHEGRPFSTLTLDIRDDRIAGVYIVADQKKLSHLPNLEDAP